MATLLYSLLSFAGSDLSSLLSSQLPNSTIPEVACTTTTSGMTSPSPVPLNTTTLATPPTFFAPFFPFNMAPLLASYPLLSHIMASDFFRIVLFGGLFESCRRIFHKFYNWAISRFLLTAYFEEDDLAYDWMMFWLSNRTGLRTSREVEISTRSFGLNNCGVILPGEESDPLAMAMADADDRGVAFLPCASNSYALWWRGRRITVMRIRTQSGHYGRTEETLRVTIWSWSHQPLADLLLEAKREYVKAQQNSISIYVTDSGNCWRHSTTRPKRDLRSIVLDPGMQELILDDARDFLESKNWYSARGIPFRRGYLLYGAPGSGKTSIIHAIAGELQLDVYIVSLSRSGMDDSALSELITNLPPRCIALMEDIDAAFHHGLTREVDDSSDNSSSDQAGQEGGTGSSGNSKASTPPSSSRLSLSGLLNALDGVGAQEGRILFATTNKYTALDPALCRPGRMDIHVEFKLASKFQAKELFRRFYLPDHDESRHNDRGESSSPGEDLNKQTSKKTQMLRRRKADDVSEVEKDSEGYRSEGSSPSDDDSDSLESDSRTHVDSPSEESAQGVPPSPSSSSDDATIVDDLTPNSYASGKLQSTRGRKCGPTLSRIALRAKSKEFANAIPERVFSMAALQGYLMAYKTRPVEAVQHVKEWVEMEMDKRGKKC